jgi:hypothetical protein
MKTVNDMSKLIGTGGVGDSSKEAQNSLMAIFNGQSVLLSRFVGRELLSCVDDSMIGLCRKVLTTDPVWQGKVTELEVLKAIETRSTMMFRNSAGVMEEWQKDDCFSFSEAADDCFREATSLSWFLPKNVYQPCFDAIYRVSPDVVRFIQVTDAADHSCNLKYLEPFLKSLDAHVVEMVFVLRKNKYDSFKLPNPEVFPSRINASNDSKIEHQSYVDLLAFIQTIKSEKGSLCPQPTIIIRKVTY